MKTIKLLVIAVAALSVASCCSCRSGRSKNNASLTGNTWQLTQLEGRAFTAAADAYTLTFEDNGRVAGKGDCNRISGTYTTSGKGKINIPMMASTRMMCPNQANENKFLELLRQTDSYTIDGNVLMLTSDGELKLVMTVKAE